MSTGPASSALASTSAPEAPIGAAGPLYEAGVRCARSERLAVDVAHASGLGITCRPFVTSPVVNGGPAAIRLAPSWRGRTPAVARLGGASVNGAAERGALLSAGLHAFPDRVAVGPTQRCPRFRFHRVVDRHRGARRTRRRQVGESHPNAASPTTWTSARGEPLADDKGASPVPPGDATGSSGRSWDVTWPRRSPASVPEVRRWEPAPVVSPGLRRASSAAARVAASAPRSPCR